MQIANDSVVEFHYKLTNDENVVIDESSERGPLAYLHGKGNIIPGLEKQLLGKAVGDKFTAVIEPEEAYGEKREDLVQKVPTNIFQGVDKVEVGMQFQVESPQGPAVVVVTKVEDDGITVDQNHPLAGVRLTFEVEIVSIREATPEEVDHGHVHGKDQH